MGRTRDRGPILWASAAFILLPSRPLLGFPRVREPLRGRGREQKEEADDSCGFSCAVSPGASFHVNDEASVKNGA